MSANSEGYADPTANTAIGNVMREQRRHETRSRWEDIRELVGNLKEVSAAYDFEIVGRITFRDTRNGRIYE